MNYTALVNRSFAIAWKHRYLWVFGFFAGLGGNTLGNIGGRGGNEQAGRLFEWTASHPVLLLVIIMGGVILWCVLTALQSLSFGALIGATGDLLIDRANDFDRSLEAGFRYFWRVFGLQLLLGLTILGIVAITVIPPLLLLLTKQTGLIILAVAWLVILALPFIAAVATATVVWDFALRFGVLRDRKAGNALGEGWRLFRNNLGRSAAVWGVMAALGLAFSFAVMLAVVMLGLPFLIAGAINPWLGIIPSVLIGLPLMIVMISMYGVFDVAYWSAVFLDLTTTAPADAPAIPPPGEPFELPPAAGMA